MDLRRRGPLVGGGVWSGGSDGEVDFVAGEDVVNLDGGGIVRGD